MPYTDTLYTHIDSRTTLDGTSIQLWQSEPAGQFNIWNVDKQEYAFDWKHCTTDGAIARKLFTNWKA